LSFNDIQSDYYQLPLSDLEKIKKEEEKVREELSKESENIEDKILEGKDEIKMDDPVEKKEEDDEKEKINQKKFPSKRYKIQEVIKPNQVILVQVLKDERGLKGAALSTFISIAGKYIVLMPNTAKGGGISRKIFNPGERKKIRNILNEITIPKEMGIIVRTAGSNKTKNEIDNDLKNLIKVWDQIKDNALNSIAPSLIHQESDIIKRCIRDMYDDDTQNIYVEGNEGYQKTKNYLKLMMPNQVKKFSDGNYSLKQLPIANGGIVVMDPYSGRVLALSGGFSFKHSEFNRASQAKRQPGSAFKPFIYALALENNYSPTSLVLDAPIVLDQGNDLKMWKPENYGKKFYGPSTLRTGIEKSRNLMTVRIAQELGIDKIINFSKKLNIYENPDELMSVSLGSAETTLLKITSAYCSFLNGGKLVNPILIDRIQDSEGKTIFNNEKRYCENCDLISYDGTSNPIINNKYQQIFSPQTAYQITSMLKGVIERGTGKGLRDLKLELAGKTGTTNKNTDTWFIGFTSNLVVGVYIGYDNPESLGKFETGSKTAMPVFKEFIKKTANTFNARPFKAADNIKMMVIDAKTGKKANSKTKLAIIESFKKNDNKLDNISNNFDSRLNTTNILKFY
ncbi:penicillin-binding transpeptidase domain-containing protein, partial [Candidatus Pelagibacter sp.]|nr:penicillin-binding transpeptidase domain-containing protein [Candidatus Pelagibacter sp.]